MSQQTRGTVQADDTPPETLCFRLQFEAWLSCQKATTKGLVGAPAAERRCTVRCIHNAEALLERQLFKMWGNMTAEGAYSVLSKPDVVVTNQSDKEAQLPKILALDRMVSECMMDLEAGLSA